MRAIEPNSHSTFLRRQWPLFAAIASGVWLALCFPPFKLGNTAFLALSPLLCAVWIPRGMTPWRRFRLGYVTGLVAYTTIFWWLGELAPLFHSPGLRLLPLGMGAGIALVPAIWAMFVGWFAGRQVLVEKPDPLAPNVRPVLLSSTRNIGLGIVVAASWVALEWLRGWAMLGFRFNTLGVALYGDVILIQIAEFTGVGGLGFLLALANAIAVITILRLAAEVGRIRLRPHFDFLFTIALIVGTFSYGIRTLVKGAPKEIAALRVAAVQTNIPQPMKMDPDRVDEVLERLKALNAKAVEEKSDVVLWPEACIPGGMFADREMTDWVKAQAALHKALLLGTDDLNRGGEGDDHNSAALIIRGREDVSIHDKVSLVPFGEYLPLRPLLGGMFGNLVPGDFVPGIMPMQLTLDAPNVTLGPLICFEDTQPEVARAQVRGGAQLLVNVTNDGWFGLSGQLEQHVANAIFRCVETRVPMVRATNTGTTGSVDIFGRVDRWLPQHTADVASRTIPILAKTPPTLFVRHGDWFSPFCAVIAALAAIGRIVVLRRKSVKNSD
jgi:apolipoprotein N-acyltransferase